MSSPRILLIDIETAPSLGFVWQKWETNVLKFVKEWELLSFAYKVLNEGKTHCFVRPDYPTDDSDYSLASATWEICNDADILIGHNIDKFDSKRLRAKWLEHGFNPPKPYKTIDTLKIARSQFAFNSNSLNDLAFTLKLGKKVSTGGIDLWFQCMAGDSKAWARMKKYNVHDVNLLEKVYTRLAAWYPAHPSLTVYEDRPGCPVCGLNKVQRRGYQVLKVRKVPRYQCQNAECGHWYKGSAA